MSQDLQNLIEKIKKEAIGSSEAESEKIIAQAREKAKKIVDDATKQAEDLRQQAEKDASLSAERAQRTMQQLARDVLISVGQNLEKMVVAMLVKSTDATLDDALLKDMILAVTKAYAENSVSGSAKILLSEADQKKLGDYMKQEFARVLKDGVEVEATPNVKAGFRVSFDGTHVSHEFTREAIAETLSGFLRPQLADAVRNAAQETESH